MAQIVTMPKLGLTMTSGKITLWLKQEGDPVAAGEPLVEIETDKITSTVESPVEGYVLKILAAEWDDREITAPLCVLGAQNEGWEDALNAPPVETAQPEQESPQAAAPQPAQQPVQGALSGRVVASPVAKRLAAENGLDLSAIVGSGPDGRIEKKDIELLLSQRGAPAADEAGGIAVARRVPLAGARKVSAARLTASKHDIPHVYFRVSVDATALFAARQKALAGGGKCSLNDVIVKAAAMALTDMPEVNSSLVGEEILCYKDVNIGVATNTDRGLLVPVVRRADRMSLREIAASTCALIARARAGAASLEDLSGGTFTISNLGALGVDEFSAVILPPQAAILAVGRIADAPCVIDGGIFIRPQMHLTLSVDHRVIDGALAAAFLARLKEILESADTLLS